MLPKHLNVPLTIIASLVQRASHSSILKKTTWYQLHLSNDHLFMYMCLHVNLFIQPSNYLLFVYLWEVSITLLPSLIMLVSTFQRNRLVAGSIPVVGSSSRRIGGLPTRAIAVLSFLLLPPLNEWEILQQLMYYNKPLTQSMI